MRLSISVGLRMVLLALLIFSSAHLTLARIGPSFLLDYCSWHATDIVLVEVTPRPGTFRVMDSWKGDLEAGSTLAVSELQPAAGAMEIADYPKGFAEILSGGRSEEIPAQAAGSRLVLFLKRAAEAFDGQWKPADIFGEMKTSAVWIDGGQLYAFRQLMNPGPSVLVPWDVNLDKMKDRVREIRGVQADVAKVTAIEDGAARAAGLKVYVRSDVLEAQQLALSELGRCGPKALTTIRDMLSDPALADERAELIKAFAEAGGELAGAELDRRLQEQLKFWQATAPALSAGWWNQDPTPHAPLRGRYTQTWQLVLSLERVHYRPALATVEQLGSLWRSLPQLNDASGLNQMVTECDKVVELLRAN